MPAVTRAFGACDERQLWQQPGAALDLWPPAVEFFERAEADDGIGDKYQLVAQRLLDRPLAPPQRPADLRRPVGTVPDTAG